MFLLSSACIPTVICEYDISESRICDAPMNKLHLLCKIVKGRAAFVIKFSIIIPDRREIRFRVRFGFRFIVTRYFLGNTFNVQTARSESSASGFDNW